MTLKEFIISRVQLFFFLVPLILTATVVIGSVAAPEQEIHYYQLLNPIITAGLCVLPTCVTYFRKEPTLKQYIPRLAIQLVLIQCVVMILISPPADGGITPIQYYLLLNTAVVFIYVLTMLMFWFQKYRQSKKLTEQLKKLQKEQTA